MAEKLEEIIIPNSKKDIQIPERKEYIKKLINKIESHYRGLGRFAYFEKRKKRNKMSFMASS